MASRALVLGGGGTTGIAWEVGVLQGLQEAGVDIVNCDVVVGTSASAFVGAKLLAEGSIDGLYKAQLSDPVDADEVASLRAGTAVTVIEPSPRSRAALGSERLGLLDPARKATGGERWLAGRGRVRRRQVSNYCDRPRCFVPSYCQEVSTAGKYSSDSIV